MKGVLCILTFCAGLFLAQGKLYFSRCVVYCIIWLFCNDTLCLSYDSEVPISNPLRDRQKRGVVANWCLYRVQV